MVDGAAAAVRMWRLGRRSKTVVAIGLAMIVIGATASLVGADAPDPVVPITASAVLNADNSTTVTVSGRWEWPTHGNKDCNDDRYAVGWAIDWNDPNQPGNPIAQVNGQGPVIDVGTAAANQYNPADNATHFYTGPNPPRCGTLDPVKHYPVGNWGPLAHTYAPGVQAFGPCVVTYDIHGSGSPDTKDLLAGGPDRARDNSVEKNDNTPLGNGCFSGLLKPDLKIVKTASAPQVTVGESLTYTLVASNTGIITVAAPVVTDTLPADVTVTSLDPRCTQTGVTIRCTLAQLAPGASAPPISIVVTTNKVGTIANTAVVTPDDDTPDDNTSTVTTTVIDKPVSQVLTITVDKTNDADGNNTYGKDETAASAGSAVKFKAVVKNESAVAVKILTLTDEWAGKTAFNPSECASLIGVELAAGASSTPCLFTVSNYSPAAGSSLENTVRAKVEEVGKPANTKEALSKSIVRTRFTPPNPPTLTFDLAKTNDANGNGTFTDSETAASAGANVPFRVTIKNTSAVSVTITKLTDEWAGKAAFTPGGTCGPLVGTKVLAPNASVTCDFVENGYAPAAGSTRINAVVVTVTETGDPSNTLTKSDVSAVTTALTPPNPPTLTFDLTKANDANGNGTFTSNETAGSAGANVPFRVTIKNTATVSQTIVKLTDEWPGKAAFTPGGTCAPLVGTKVLAPGASVTCDFTENGYAPPAGSTRTNTVLVTLEETGNPDNMLTKAAVSIVGTQFAPPPPPQVAVTVDKSNDADGNGAYTKSETATGPGAAVPFKVVITNTSNVVVTVANITDQWVGKAAFTPTTAVAGQTTCSSLVGTNLNAGQTATCFFLQSAYAPAAGSSLTDTVVVSVNETGNPANKGTGSSNSTVSTPFTPPPPPQLSVTVDKTNNADGQGGFSKAEVAPAPGADVAFRVVFTNTSNVAVKVDGVTDQWVGKAAFGVCASVVGTTLQPNQSVTCNFTVNDYAPAAGSSLTNTVLVTVSEATSPGNKATASSNSTVTTLLQPPPALTFGLTKLNDANGDGTFNGSEQATAAGANVPFRVTITNTSSVPVVISTFTDQWPGTNPFTPGGTCGPLVGTTVQPNAVATCTFTQNGYAPAAGSSLINTVVVTVVQQGNPSNSTTNSSQSTVTTPLVPPPPPGISMTVDKTSDANGDGTFTKAEQATAAGASVPFRVTITNTSAAPVVVSAITDQWPGTAPFTPAGTCGPLVGTKVLAPKGQAGDTVTCNFTLTNYAPATGSTRINTVITTVSEQANPVNSATGSSNAAVSTGINPPPPPAVSMTVNKTTDANGDGTFSKNETAPLPGAPVKFRAVVTNTSAIPVIVASLTDSVPGEAAVPICPNLIGSTLAPGASVTCDFTRPAPASGTTVTDTVLGTVTEVGNPANQATNSAQAVVTTQPVVSATVVKTNDANGDGTFTDNETSSAPGSPVSYRAVITNTSAVPVAIGALTDAFPGQAPVGVCPELLNTVLPPGASVTCTFTAPAPAAGPDVTDTVQATVVDVGNPNNSTTVQDVSTVRTVQVLPLVLANNVTAAPPAPIAAAPAALPQTGADSARRLALAMVFLGAGLVLVGLAGARRPRRLSPRSL